MKRIILLIMLIMLTVFVGCDTQVSQSGKKTSKTYFTVVLDANDGTDRTADIKIEITGKKIKYIIPECPFDPTNDMTFLYWSDASGDSGVQYDVSADWTFQVKNGSITLYAIWKAASKGRYYVELNPNNGTDQSADKMIFLIDQKKALKTIADCGFTPPAKNMRFDCWTTQADGNGGDTYEDGQRVTNLAEKDKTIKLYAQWVLKEYFFIRFHDEKFGNNVEDVTFDLNNTLDLLSEVSEVGYTFDGWYDGTSDAAVKVVNTAGLTDDIDVYAHWSANTYTVAFYKNASDAKGLMTAQKMVYDTEAALSEREFTRAGYRFIGWNIDESADSAQYTDGQIVKNLTDDANVSVSLYAIWQKADTYIVIFNAGSGSGDMENVTFVTDEDSRLPKCTFIAPTGQIFAGWNTRKDGSGDNYENMEIVNVLAGKDETVTLYAQWTEKTCFVAYLTDEMLHTEMEDVTFDKVHNVVLPTPTTKCYVFRGWFDNADLTGDAVTGWTAGEVTDDIRLYAKWEVGMTTYTVKTLFQAVSGDEYEQNLTEYPDVIRDCTMDLITDETADEIVGFNAVLPIEQQEVTADGSTVVEIKYNRKTITYTFKPNGGSLGGSAEPVSIHGRYGAVCTISAPTRTGYTFNGWNKSVPTAFGAEDDTFTAQWTVNTYKITYNANKPSLETSAVSGTMTDTSCVYGDNCTVSSNGYTLEHYTFSSWNTKSGGTGTTYTVGSTKSLTGNVTLYAQWTPKTYTITYHGDSITPWDGIVTHKTSSGNTIYTKTYSWGNSVTLTNNFVGTYTYQYLTDYWVSEFGAEHPTYSTTDIGYTHAGWAVSANSTDKTYNTAQTINNCQLGDADLYALWETDKYYVIYYSNMNIGDKYCYPEDPNHTYEQWTNNSKSNAVYVASLNTSSHNLKNPSEIGDGGKYWIDSNRKFLSWSESPDGCYEYAKESGKTITISKSKITHLYAVWYYDYSRVINGGSLNGGSRTFDTAYVDQFETTVGNFYRVMGYCWIPGTLPDKTRANWDKYPIQATNIFRIFDYCNTLSRLLGYTKCYTPDGRYNGSTATTEMNCNKTNTGYRLPDKDEWFYYASDTGFYGSGSYLYTGGKPVGDVAWYSGNSGNKYHIVGGKLSSNNSMYDACGNVSELCHYSDTLVYDYSDKVQYPSTNYHGYDMYICGGDYSKDADKVKLSSYSSIDNRQNYDTNPDDFGRNTNVGFRVMRRM